MFKACYIAFFIFINVLLLSDLHPYKIQKLHSKLISTFLHY